MISIHLGVLPGGGVNFFTGSGSGSGSGVCCSELSPASPPPKRKAATEVVSVRRPTPLSNRMTTKDSISSHDFELDENMT